MFLRQPTHDGFEGETDRSEIGVEIDQRRFSPADLGREFSQGVEGGGFDVPEEVSHNPANKSHYGRTDHHNLKPILPFGHYVPSTRNSQPSPVKN